MSPDICQLTEAGARNDKKMKNFKGFGRGLQSLIPTKSVNESKHDKRDSIFYVEINKVKPNTNQPRRDFDGGGIKELAQSIKKYGILQPLLVSKKGIETKTGLDVEYYLIAGERRLRASKEAGLQYIPVIIKDTAPHADRNSLVIALMENIQRKDLNSIEEADAFSKLRDDFGLTFEQIASRLGRSSQSINNSVRLLALPGYIKDALRGEKLSMGHARALLSIKDPAKQKEAYINVTTFGTSVREIESFARSHGAAIKKRKYQPIGGKDKKFEDLEKNLGEKLNTTITIRTEDGNKGKLTARFSTHQHLNEIVKTILD